MGPHFREAKAGREGVGLSTLTLEIHSWRHFPRKPWKRSPGLTIAPRKLLNLNNKNLTCRCAIGYSSSKSVPFACPTVSVIGTVLLSRNYLTLYTVDSSFHSFVPRSESVWMGQWDSADLIAIAEVGDLDEDHPLRCGSAGSTGVYPNLPPR